ncbi:MAG: acyl-CoA dehydrogenase, partial [Planococcus donghaensis]
MLKELSPKAEELKGKLIKFMDEYVYPNEATVEKYLEEADDRWTIPPIIEELKDKAKEQGLWNLFIDHPE